MSAIEVSMFLTVANILSLVLVELSIVLLVLASSLSLKIEVEN